MTPFHLAFPILDIDTTKRFYGDLLGCRLGRSTDRWVDFDFFGHQLSAHVVDAPQKDVPKNHVDGKGVPVQHFGAIFEWETWHQLAEKLRNAKIEFVIEPYLRFEGLPGEQATMFFLDPSGNALEFKSFKDPNAIFALQ